MAAQGAIKASRGIRWVLKSCSGRDLFPSEAGDDSSELVCNTRG
jgi:hypothetical protein